MNDSDMKRVVLKFLVIAVLAISAVLTSCNKDDDYTRLKLMKTKVKLLKTIIEDDTEGFRYEKYKFEYDVQNRITEISEYFYGGDLYSTTTFTYAGDDLVQVLHSFSGGSFEMYEYTKNGNTITQKYTYSGDTYISNFTTTSTIELDSDGLPVKREGEKDEYGNTNVETYEYQDGNLTKNTRIAILPQYDYTEYYTNTYYYDNEKGTLSYCKTPKWYLIMYLNDFGVKNNITEGGHLYRPWSVYTYKFDGAGFPTKRKSKNYYHMFENERIEEFVYNTM